MSYLKKEALSFQNLTEKIKALAPNGRKFRAGQGSTIPNTEGVSRTATHSPTTGSHNSSGSTPEELYREYYERHD